MQWAEYQSIIEAEWKALLERTPPPEERDIQQFMQMHPSMVPGAFGIRGGTSGHYPLYGTVIAQAVLPSYNNRRPDFMWLANDSEKDEPLLVEIESPGKKWWTESGRQTADLTQALDQIAEWKMWFDKPQNEMEFRDYYGLDRNPWIKRPLRPEYVLIYGRRKEANRTSELEAKRSKIRDHDIQMMTYDGLKPDANASELLCAKKSGSEFEAISVPPTITIGPTLARSRKDVKGKEAAAQASAYLSAKRKAFLVSRWAYWDDWATSNPNGFHTVGDRE